MSRAPAPGETRSIQAWHSPAHPRSPLGFQPCQQNSSRPPSGYIALVISSYISVIFMQCQAMATRAMIYLFLPYRLRGCSLYAGLQLFVLRQQVRVEKYFKENCDWHKIRFIRSNQGSHLPEQTQPLVVLRKRKRSDKISSIDPFIMI